MKLFRTIEAVADGNYTVGDIISFSLKIGEKVEALAVKQEADGMIFVLVDCLLKEYPMNKDNSNEGGYETSLLRKKLNGKILEMFPSEIREKMIAFPNGDLLRLPTEREIFGENVWGEDEPDTVEQWEPMKLRKNRIAFQGTNGEWEWYWLQNPVETACFAGVNIHGFADYYAASSPLGVRPAFKI